jgi:hypothetical protein
VINQSVLSVSSSIKAFVSPGLISELDNRIRLDFQLLDHRFFSMVAISAIVVAIGCAMEGPDLFHELWPDGFPCFSGQWVKRVGLIGWFLVVLGVGAEGVFEIFDHHASGLLQTFDEVLLAEAQNNAGSAQLSALGAAAAAQKAREQSSDASTLAEDAENNIVSAKEQAAEAESRLAKATERTLRLEQQLSWRTVTPEQKEKLEKLLLWPRLFLPLRKLKVSIQYLNQNPEAEEYAHELKDALGGFGAEISEPNGVELFGAKALQGTIMSANPARNPDATLLLKAMNDAGIPVSGQTADGMDEHNVVVTVGSKPHN